MQCFKTAAPLQKMLEGLRCDDKRISLVPTMGYLHEGHLDLVKAASESGSAVVTSIFVNPLQFGPGEDFGAYPRDSDRDLDLLRNRKIAAVFMPDADDIVGKEPLISVDPGPMADVLCGQYRPGHYRGVCTIVSKLLNIVKPDAAFFGWKDAQQLIILKHMVADLSYPVEVYGVETRRECDGLAMSSRNIYLDNRERALAPQLYEVLQQLKTSWEAGEISSSSALETHGMRLLVERGFRPQYISIVNLADLRPLESPQPGNSLLAAAVYLGTTRLIDNIKF